MGKTSTQSSTAFGGTANRANDGNTDGNFADGSVSHTNFENQPWWQVDLGSSQQVTSVKVWNRTDCCQSRTTNFNVIVSDQPIATVGYIYDAAGNVTFDGVHSYIYDGENRLVSVDAGSTARYYYDFSGRRVMKVSGGVTTHYVWEGGRVLAEHDGSTGSLLVDYIYEGNTLIAKVAGGVRNYFVNDRLSVRMALDTSGNVLGRQGHLLFGEEFAESGQQEKHHFTSYESDAETALDYAINRFYSPATGRFGTVDRFNGSARATVPQSWNRYSYVQNDPVDFTDANGLSITGCASGLVGAGACIVCLTQYSEFVYAMTITCTGANAPYAPIPAMTITIPPFVTGGGGSSGGNDARSNLHDFLQNNVKCAQKLDQFVLDRFAKGKTTSPYLEHLAASSSINLYTSYAPTDTLLGLGLVGRKDPLANVYIEYLFGNHAVGGGSALVGWTSQLQDTIILGYSYTSSTDPAFQAAVLAHELLHEADRSLSHREIADKLGVDYDKNATDPEAAANKAITDWIKGGCQDK